MGRADEVADVVLEERQEDRDGLLRLHLEHEAPIVPGVEEDREQVKKRGQRKPTTRSREEEGIS